jgi:hypothetical protein
MTLLKFFLKKKTPIKRHHFAPKKNPSSFFPSPVFFPIAGLHPTASPSHVLAKGSELKFNVLGYQHLVLLIYLLVLPFEDSFMLQLSVFVEK